MTKTSAGLEKLDNKQPLVFFWLFIVLHTLFWTLGPLLTRSSLPHDTLESITWGMQWQWGYNKHPFLAAWFSAGISKLFNAVEWPVYLLAQMAIATTFIATWQLGRKLLPAKHAIIAALALDGILYYNINSFNITPDSLQSPLWVLFILFFYQALTTQFIRYWLATAIMAVLCIVTKYQVVMLFLPMVLFCLVNQRARVSFCKPGLYIAMGLMLLLLTPHLVWLWQHDFITMQYAVGAPYGYEKKTLRIMCLLRYFLNCMAYTAGLFLLLWPFYNKKKTGVTTHPVVPSVARDLPHLDRCLHQEIPRRKLLGTTGEQSLSKFNWQFLLFTGLGPCFLTALFCFITGGGIPVRWSTPYFFLLGIMMMSYLKPDISALKLKQFFISLAILSMTLWGIRMSTIVFHTNVKSDAYLPNKIIASKLAQLWKQHYSTRLYYLGGAHYLVGATIPYFVDKPIPYFSWDPKENPWINEQDLVKHGGIFIWDTGVNYFWDAYSPKLETLPDAIKQRFPDFIILGTYTFYRQTPTPIPVKVGVALLPPADSYDRQ